MKSCRGFLTLPIAGYALAGMAAVIVVMGVALWALDVRLDSVRAALATEKARSAMWEATSRECSEATKRAVGEAETRKAAALAALQRARDDSARGRAEVERLRAAKPTGGSGCPAGDAVRHIRGGLKE